MATKTKAIEVKVDDWLAEAISESNLGGLRVFAAKDSHENALPDDELFVNDAGDLLILEGEGLVPTDEAHPTTGITHTSTSKPATADTPRRSRGRRALKRRHRRSMM